MLPDYETARQQAGFRYSLGSSQGALRALSGVPIHEFNLQPAACIEAYQVGRPLIREMFGPEVTLPGITTPAISYGHVNGLGCELIFPEGGEVGHTHVYDSLAEGIKRLAEPVEWAQVGWAPFFLEFHATLKQAFPGERVGFSWGLEGPLTTAYELRGDGFFLDLLDDPEGCKQFLSAIVHSLVDFREFNDKVNEATAPRTASGLVDDIASFVPPRLFPELVVPFWEQWLAAQSQGTRHAHVEDLRVEQLPYLEAVGLSDFDPSISPRLHPGLIAAHCRVPFTWRLGSIHYREMSVQEVQDFVFKSAADGASGVTTVISEASCNEASVPKVAAFQQAGQVAQEHIQAGGSREELAGYVSPEGREKLWEGWCGFLGPRSSRGGAKDSQAC
jgi:hypothetical protein